MIKYVWSLIKEAQGGVCVRQMGGMKNINDGFVNGTDVFPGALSEEKERKKENFFSFHGERMQKKSGSKLLNQ